MNQLLQSLFGFLRSPLPEGNEPAIPPELSRLHRGLGDRVAEAVAVRGGAPLQTETIQRVRTYLQAGKVRLEELVGLLHQDPLLVVRLMAMANRAAFQRAGPARSIGEVVRRLGTRRLLDTIEDCGSATSLDELRAGAPAFHYARARTQIASSLTDSLMQVGEGAPDRDLVAVSRAFWEAPLLGLAWQYPALYGAMMLGRASEVRAEGRSREQHIERWVGLSRAGLVAASLQGLMLPEDCRRFLSYCSLGALKGSGPSTAEVTELRKIAGLCLGPSVLVDEYLSFAGRGNLEEIVREWQTRLSLPGGSIVVAFSKLADALKEPSDPSPISGWRLPTGPMFTRLGEAEPDDDQESSRPFDEAELQSNTKLVGALVAEIKREHQGVPEMVMRAYQLWLTGLGLLHAIKFDRVAILVVDYQRGQLCRGAVLGRQPSILDAYERSIAESSKGSTVELLACRERRAVFGGKSIGADGGQACAFPLMDADGVQGVVYAERVGPSASRPLGLDHKMAVTAFAECWQQ